MISKHFTVIVRVICLFLLETDAAELAEFIIAAMMQCMNHQTPNESLIANTQRYSSVSNIRII